MGLLTHSHLVARCTATHPIRPPSVMCKKNLHKYWPAPEDAKIPGDQWPWRLFRTVAPDIFSIMPAGFFPLTLNKVYKNGE